MGRGNERWTDGGAAVQEAAEDKRQHDNQLGQSKGMRARTETWQNWMQ
jgi:hypothetical protein